MIASVGGRGTHGVDLLCDGVDGRYYGSVGVSLWSIVGCRDSGCRGCTRVSVFL